MISDNVHEKRLRRQSRDREGAVYSLTPPASRRARLPRAASDTRS